MGLATDSVGIPTTQAAVTAASHQLILSAPTLLNKINNQNIILNGLKLNSHWLYPNNYNIIVIEKKNHRVRGQVYIPPCYYIIQYSTIRVAICLSLPIAIILELVSAMSFQNNNQRRRT